MAPCTYRAFIFWEGAMSRLLKPFTVARRGDTKTFQKTLSSACGLSAQVCAEWHRRGGGGCLARRVIAVWPDERLLSGRIDKR
jgi:hypothetical protein